MKTNGDFDLNHMNLSSCAGIENFDTQKVIVT